jgi:hypothetical protein
MEQVYLRELLKAYLQGLITKQECCELLMSKIITATNKWYFSLI